MCVRQGHDFNLGHGPRLSGHHAAKEFHGRFARTSGSPHVIPATPATTSAASVQRRQLQQVTYGSTSVFELTSYVVAAPLA